MWSDFLKNIAVSIFGFLLRVYLWFCYKTSEFIHTTRIKESLRDTCDAGIGMVYLFWHDEFMLVALTTFSERLRPASIVTGTQFGGLVSARFSQSQGIKAIFIDRSETREMRMSRLIESLRLYPKMGIAADYGAPWFSARPTSLQIAYASKSLVVPVHVKPNRCIVFNMGGAKAVFPLPFSRFIIYASQPICPTAAQALSGSELSDIGPAMLNRALGKLRELSAMKS